MSDIQTALKNFLCTDGAISALLGERVQYGEIPQGDTWPVVCLWCIGDNPVIGLSGKSSKHTVSVYRIDIYSESAATTRALRKAILDRLNGFSGLMFQKPIEGQADESITVFSAIYQDGRSVQYSDVRKLYGWECEYELAYVE